MKYNTFSWVEIPVTDMHRAITFYESVFDITLQPMNFGGLEMAWFPNAGDAYGATGTLIKQESYVPSEKGPLVYFACENLQNELDRVVAAGGKIYQPKTLISEDHGYMGVMIDSEGNRVAFHSKQ